MVLLTKRQQIKRVLKTNMETLESDIKNANSIGDLVDIYDNMTNHIKELVLENPNDYDLGEKIRPYAINYLEVLKK